MTYASTTRINSLIDELQHKLLVMQANTDVSFSEDVKKLNEIRVHVLKVDNKKQKHD
jgi:hypothetical protein